MASESGETEMAEHDTLESMEGFLSSPRKRKAEIHDLDFVDSETTTGEGETDSGKDSSGDGGFEKIEEKSSETGTQSDSETEPEWGYDSFDEYDPNGVEADEWSDQEIEKQFRRYKRQLYASKGFHVDEENVPKDLFQGIRPLTDLDMVFKEPNITVRQYMEGMASMALAKYNQLNGSNLEFERLIRANLRGSSCTKSYITFLARDIASGNVVEYQAKTEWKVWHKKTYPIFCRPSPMTPKE